MFTEKRVNEAESGTLMVIQSLSSWGRGQIRRQGLFHEGTSQQSRLDDFEGACRRLQTAWPGESPNCAKSPECSGQDRDTARLIPPRLRKHPCSHPLSHFPTPLSSPPIIQRQPSGHSRGTGGVWAAHRVAPLEYLC